MKRKLLIVFLTIISVVCLCFGLAACGGSSDSSGSTTSSSSSDSSGSSSSIEEDSSGSDSSSADKSYEESVTVDKITYKLSGYTYKVTSADKDITSAVILSEYDGLPVTTIGSSAFNDCTSLISVTVPDSVTSISSGAFSGCSSLVSMTLPFVGTSAGNTEKFSYTEAACFGEIFGTSSYEGGQCVINPYYSMDCYIPSTLTMVTITGGTYIANEAFYNCSMLTSITILDSVTYIGYDAFAYCTSLTSITIPDSVTFIGGWAFRGCSSLVSITLPFVGSSAAYDEEYTSFDYFFDTSSYDGATDVSHPLASGGSISYYIPSTLTTVIITGGTYIDENAFYDCSMIKSITIPESVTSIGSNAFFGCKSLESVYYNGTASQWASISFESNPLSYAGSLYLNGKLATDITLENITEIGSSVFSGCTSLTSITIPDSVTSIGMLAFSGCKSLKSITIPDSVETIGMYAFRGCTSLTSIVLPDNLTSIEESVFYNCTSLTSITIPESVTSIGTWAFDGCTSLTSVTIGNSVTTIGGSAFYNCTSLTSITIPDSVTSIGYYAFYNCTALTEINFNATAMEDLSSDNQVFYKAGRNGDGITVTIGANVTSIPTYLFCPYISTDGYYLYECMPKITSVVFEENSVCTSIGDYAFAYCMTLATISNMPSSVSFDANIVTDCTSLDVSSLCSADGNVNYFGTQMINVVDTTAETIVVREGTTSIAENAFANCANLRVVYIPSTVTEIGDGALVCGVDSNLIVYFGASVSNNLFNSFRDWLGTFSYTYTADGTENTVDVYYMYVTGVKLAENYLYSGSTVYGYVGSETEISIPSALNGSTVKSIGYSQAITVADGVSYIMPLSSFLGVTSITLPSAMTDVNAYAFYNNTTLTSVTLLADSGELMVYSGAFYGCTNLSSVTFTEGAEVTLQYQSFYGCTSLKSLTLPSTTTSIIMQAFEESGLTSLTITDATTAYLYTVLTEDLSGVTEYTLSDYSAEQLAALVTGDWMGYNMLINISNVTD